jgi:hypothetical protein
MPNDPAARHVRPVCKERQRKRYFCSVRLRGASVVLVVVALLGGCSANTAGPATTTTGPATTTTAAGSLNATPCNYAQAWRDNPGQFSEYSTMARYARIASNAELRAEGQQLASALTADNTHAFSGLADNVFTTCQSLGLVRSPPAVPSTT